MGAVGDSSCRHVSWRLRRGSFVFGLVVFSALALPLWLAFLKPSADCPIEIPKASLDFGVAWEQDSFEWRLPVTNLTDECIEIVAFRTSCHLCSSIYPQRLVLEPRKQQSVTLTLNLGRPHNSLPSLSARDFSVSLVPLFRNVLKETRRFTVIGRVQPLIQQNGGVFNFDHELIIGQPLKAMSITLNVVPDVLHLDAATDDSLAVVTLEHKNEQPEYELTAILRSNTSPGPFEIPVKLVPRGRDGERLPPSTVRFTGAVVPDIRLMPGSLVLGSQAVGELVERHVVVESRTGSDFSIADVTFNVDDGLEVHFAAGALGSRHELHVLQEIQDVGSTDHVITVTIHHAQGVSECVSVNVWYYGFQSF